MAMFNVSTQRALASVQNMNIRSNYLYRACFVCCGGHFEFLIRARGTRGLLVRSLEPIL